MDKYEYKIRSEEIKSLIAERAYAEAAEIADTIDWRRVKSVMMLCMISDLYKVNRRYEDAKNMLLLAYDKKPGGRTICYSLCELCIKTEEFVQAVNYYNEFMRVAPKDPERYILQYKLYEAQDVNLVERISVLEELKKRDYREKWAYELAYLYHRVGLATRCVEECDELILWFGQGKYVIKAMELKMLHQPLTFSQQEIYDHRFDEYVEEAEQYTEEAEAQNYGGQDGYEGQEETALPYQGNDNGGQEAAWGEQNGNGEPVPEEMDIQVKTVDVSKYNTMNLQEELAAGLQEVLGAEGTGHYGGDAHGGSASDDDDMEETEIFFGETGEIDEAALEAVGSGRVSEDEKRAVAVQAPVFAAAGRAGAKKAAEQEPIFVGQETVNDQEPVFVELETVSELDSDFVESEATRGQEPVLSEKKAAVRGQEPALVEEGEAVTKQPANIADVSEAVSEDTSAVVMKQMREEAIEEQVQPPKELADVLLQETDGQIRMVLPERTAVERQITGQMKIDDILAEWERMKKENEEKCKEEVRQHVLRQTGPMFTEFEAAVRDGLLEQLEGASKERTAVVHAVKAVEIPDAAERLNGGNRTENPVQPVNNVEPPGAVQYEEAPGSWESVEGQDAGDYAEEWIEGQNGFEYAEDPEYVEGGDSQEPENPEYGDLPEWNDRQDELVYIEETEYMEDEAIPEDLAYGEAAEWMESGNEPEYVGEPGYAEGEAAEESLAYGDATEWPADEAQLDYIEDRYENGEEAPADLDYGEEWAQDGTDYTEDPVYEEEAEYRRGMDGGEDPEWAAGQDELSDYMEDAAYIEVEEDGTQDETDRLKEADPEEEEERSEALDYLEALEQVEEAVILEARGSVEDKKEAATETNDFLLTGDEEEVPEETKAGEEKAAEVSDADAAIQKESVEKKGEAEEKSRKSDKPSQVSENHGRVIQEREKARVRSMTREEKELFAPFIQNRQSGEQLVKALDSISMAAYTGNVVITGDEGMDTLLLAKNMIREVRMTDRNFLGKVAKVTGMGLNRKNVRETLEGLNNGALIIEKASGMDSKTAGMLHIALQQEKFGIIVIMEDTKKAIQKLFLGTPQLFGDFNARVDLEALSNETLVAFGKRYAREKEYSIDDLGMLALHTRIEEGQTIDHVVTVIEVKQIVDAAIRHANRKTIGHFFDILLARRYDDEDMIILTEKDFVA